MNTRFRLLYCLLLLLFSLSLWSQTRSGMITSVLDGDSYTIRTYGEEIKVRLNGIDCPESNQPFGYEATLFVTQFLNQPVTYTDLGKDKYGRTIAEVFIQGQRLSLLLVENGLAHHYIKYSSDPLLHNAELRARNKKIGLWSKPNPIKPWDWRVGTRPATSAPPSPHQQVYICASPGAKKYHITRGCPALKNCKSPIKTMTRREAHGEGKDHCLRCFN